MVQTSTPPLIPRFSGLRRAHPPSHRAIELSRGSYRPPATGRKHHLRLGVGPEQFLSPLASVPLSITVSIEREVGGDVITVLPQLDSPRAVLAATGGTFYSTVRQHCK